MGSVDIYSWSLHDVIKVFDMRFRLLKSSRPISHRNSESRMTKAITNTSNHITTISLQTGLKDLMTMAMLTSMGFSLSVKIVFLTARPAALPNHPQSIFSMRFLKKRRRRAILIKVRRRFITTARQYLLTSLTSGHQL